MSSNEFSPYEYFNHLVDHWWVLALATILGGLFGLAFYHLHTPLYEAAATYIVTIDLDRFPLEDVRQDMLQYNEDLALNTTKAILLLPEVRQNLLKALTDRGINITPNELLKNYTIERKHDIWELRYRNASPAVAQTVANEWADISFQFMLSRQAAGDAPDYVIFQSPSHAMLPEEPVLYDRNRMVFAGITLGFIAGILAASFTSRAPKKHSPAA